MSDKGAETAAGCLFYSWAGLSWLIGFVTFAGCWIYCISEYGFLFGVGLGWLPAIICAFFAGLLWPLAAIAVLVAVVFIKK